MGLSEQEKLDIFHDTAMAAYKLHDGSEAAKLRPKL